LFCGSAGSNRTTPAFRTASGSVISAVRPSTSATATVAGATRDTDGPRCHCTDSATVLSRTSARSDPTHPQPFIRASRHLRSGTAGLGPRLPHPRPRWLRRRATAHSTGRVRGVKPLHESRRSHGVPPDRAESRYSLTGNPCPDRRADVRGHGSCDRRSPKIAHRLEPAGRGVSCVPGAPAPRARPPARGKRFGSFAVNELGAELERNGERGSCSVRIRPPTRARASMTVMRRPACERSRPPQAAAPAPRISTSTRLRSRGTPGIYNSVRRALSTSSSARRAHPGPARRVGPRRPHGSRTPIRECRVPRGR